MTESQEKPSSCPVSKKKQTNELSSCPISHNKKDKTNKKTEPLDSPEHVFTQHSAHFNNMKVTSNENSNDPYDIIPGMSIPSNGRGNNDDGSLWLNPTPKQLYNSLLRKDKPINYNDALAVAVMHSYITKETWDAILEFESLHFSNCKKPKLEIFEGKDGFYSPKARLFNRFFKVPLPYDRHDWTVDRCGTKIDYVIDYYAIRVGGNNNDSNHNQENNLDDKCNINSNNDNNLQLNENKINEVNKIENINKIENNDNNNNSMNEEEYIYTIDARPKFNRIGNVIDRLRIAYRKWKLGKQWY